MATLDIQSYNINFDVLDTNDCKKLFVIDTSTYLDTPEKPLLDIQIPGFTGFISVPYTPNGVTVINSDVLRLTDECEYGDYADLPDGVYSIRMKICPYDEFTTTVYHLRTGVISKLFNSVLCKINNDIDQLSPLIKQTIIDVEILLLSAKAELYFKRIEKATEKYKVALKKLQNILKKI